MKTEFSMTLEQYKQLKNSVRIIEWSGAMAKLTAAQRKDIYKFKRALREYERLNLHVKVDREEQTA